VNPRKKKPSARGPKPLRLILAETSETIEVPGRLALLPLRDLVLFPGMTVPLFVNRKASLAALSEALSGSKILFAVTQRRAETNDPRARDLHAIGCIVRVLQQSRLPDGSSRILLEGLVRARLREFRQDPGWCSTAPDLLAERPLRGESPCGESPSTRMARMVWELFREYADFSRRVPPEALLAPREPADPATISFRIAAHLSGKTVEKMKWLAAADPGRRLRLLREALESRLAELRSQTPTRRMSSFSQRGQRPLPLDLPPRSLVGEAGLDSDLSAELNDLARAIEEARLPAGAREKAERELGRLGKMPFASPEATVCRGYLDWLVHLPWRKKSRDCTDLAKVQEILDEDHFGLQKVKERVVEQIAVMKLSREVRGPILCLVGPPGVGKTSLGRSIARALGRRFVRMSLGGIRDEAEIRGHRRTYIGSLPGRIVQAMRRAATINPVILLDEVDKLGHDHRGDPAAALLEVLDPEQNGAFNDHYLEVDYDLSKVLFITTANVLHAIPEPLRDRMEVIRIPGYLEAEKLRIARRFLLPRQIVANGLHESDLDLSDETLMRMIREYTREAGVRGLEREIARVCRRVAKVKAGGEDPALAALGRVPPSKSVSRRVRRVSRTPALGIVVPPEDLEILLGVARFADLICDRPSRVGVATGLAWTESGGEVLIVEAGVLPGRGNLILTGQLGETMRESAQAALSYVRSRAVALGLERRFYRRVDLHIHLPEGAVPKDGPSAGVAIALAMASALTRIPTRARVAMTGEITLRGNVLPVGGLGEKIVAARRAEVDTLILPRQNQKNLMELPSELREGVTFRLVETMDEILASGLERMPEAGETTDRIETSLPGELPRAA
jgi:ATP-dependent Lon protease